MPKETAPAAGDGPPKRRAIPVDVRVAVLTEAGYRCAVPTCRQILALDLHHVIEVADGGGNEIGNLLVLCPTCHALFHRGEVRRESIRVWKGMLIALSRAFDDDSVELLLFLDALSGRVPVSLDGLLRFARLVSSGLVEFTDDFGYGDGNPARAQCWAEAALTDKGRNLVAAWKSGDREGVAAALGRPVPDLG